MWLSILLIYSLSFTKGQNVYHSSSNIQRILVDEERVVVAGVNSISLLSLADLSPIHTISTGPVKDSPLCNHDGSSCLREAAPVPTDNYNMILERTKDGILACGSVKQGTCSLLSSSDLSTLSVGDVPVSANSPNASTVSLLLGESLVVAASSAIDSPYRDPFPAVSIREAPDYFVANSGSLSGEAAVFVRAELRQSLPIRYVAALRHQHFVYIAAVQPKRPRAPLVTKLIRFCDNDTRFTSYSEIELQCRSDENVNYPIVTAATVQGDRLIASFVDSSESRSAICSFPLQRIKLTFWYNIDRCRGGSDSFGLPHVGRDSKCTNKSRIPLDEDTCELGVGGSIESVEVASIELESQVLSLSSVEGTAVLMAGTDKGQIVMMKWRGVSQLEEYARRHPGDTMGAVSLGERVEKLMVIGETILAQMPKGLVSLPLSSCSHLSSCSSCLLASDPLCQWCHPLGSCGSPSECPRSTSPICPVEDGVARPARLSIGDNSTVFLPIKHLPQPLGFKYECVFGHSLSTAQWGDGGVTCATPDPTEPLPQPETRVSLALRTTLSAHPIVRFEFTLFDCRKHTTCGSCSSSTFGCDWCSGSMSCSIKGKCKGSSSTECARISSSSPLLLPNGHSSSLVLPLHRLDLLPPSPSLSCRTVVSGRNISSKATIHGDDVVCQKLSLSYSELQPNVSVSMDLLAGDALIDSVNVTLFDCSRLAPDCSSCGALDPIFRCSWCGGRCSPQCNSPTKECDRPRILEISPLSGPLEGGTLLSIVGRDLGSSIDDVSDRIFVAGSPCPVVHYEISRRIVCRVSKGSSSGPVRVSVGRAAKRTAESTQFFSFVRPSLFSIYPLFGPVSGGTKITLYGQHLNAGSNVTVSIGNVPCDLLLPRNSSSSLFCLLGPSNSVGKTTRVSLSVDGSISFLDTSFVIRADPVISNIRPATSFRSGGRTVTVQGSHLDSVLSARMVLLSSTTPPFELVSEKGDCHITNSSQMTCSTPRILHSQKTDSQFARYPVGFLMDNVTSVSNLGHRIQMRIVPDPQFAPFKGVRIHQGDQPLILDGRFLGDSTEPNDYKIFIGTERCYVTLIDSRQLVCSGPISQPKATDQNGVPITGDLPLVSVRVGNIREELGLIEYANAMATFKLWAMILATLAALFVVLFMLVVMWKRRSKERERDYKKIQLQMEHLESNVRKECKQAFAELQTSMSFGGAEEYEVSELRPLGDFVNRLLWMDGPSSPSTTTSLYASTMPLTLAQFDTLISSKHFVFALIESAESDPTLSTSDRSHLSSLITQALLRNFHYYTEVVLDLLRAHIAKSVQQQRAGLLFRHSDSVVEKLVSQWLSIAMHDSLAEHQAVTYYRLYKALKYQTERGPVDVVTGAARYTINEAKLLRETVDTTSIDCLVMDMNARGPYMVRVNACDSVSQVQQKVLDVVFKGTPHSLRPTTQHFDLEWQCPRRGNLILREMEGLTNKKSILRLNTMGQLAIPNGALLIMIPAERENEHSGSLGDSGQCSWSSLGRGPSPLSLPDNCYHLITPSPTMTLEKKRIDQSIPKSIPEVYLTRLLTSKGMVQKFIDDFLESLLFLEDSTYPPVLKYLFDVLEEEAARNGVDSSMCQQWKSNVYVVRLWASLVTNPSLLCDVPSNQSGDANMTVIAQTLADSFSTSEPMTGVHAPSSRLLFAKDVSRFRPLSADLLRRISRQPAVSRAQLDQHLSNLSHNLSRSGSTVALSELLAWVRGNGLRLVSVLSSNGECVSQRLPQRLSQVINLSFEPEHIYCTISEYSQ